jgi:autotransporter-associated beta strand protein
VLVFAGTTNGTAVVTLDGNQSAGALVFSLSSSNGYTLSQGTGGALSLGTSAGASISVLTGTYSITAPIVLAASLAVRPSNGGSLRLGNISQALGVSAALSLSGEGELILNGSDTYTGGTTVIGGLLQVGASGALPTTGSVTVTGGTLDLGAFTVTTTNAVSFQGGVTQGGIIVDNGSPYDGQGGIVSASLQGTAGLNMTGYGTLVLAGTNTYGGGTIVTEGTLEVLDPAALLEGSALTVGSDAATMFGESSGAIASLDSPAAVPEPGMLGLLAAGGFGFVAACVLQRRRVE